MSASPDDPERVARLVARDERAFSDLVREMEPRIRRMLTRMIGDPTEAEDLSHEVFIQVFKAIGDFRGESKLSTWIFRIAVNLCHNRRKYLKTRHHHRKVEIGDAEATHGSEFVDAGERPNRPDHHAEQAQLHALVREAILEVEDQYRECLILRDVEDMNYDEIAESMNLPAGTVKSRIFRGRAQLRALVEEKLGKKIA